MRRSRITITLNTQTLAKVDKLIDKNTIRNRSHAIEYILNQYTRSGVTKAVILAGGKGTKMRPYTYEIPKVLLPIHSKPLLEHLIQSLKQQGINEVILCIGYLGNKIKDHFGDGRRFGVRITYSTEEETLLTGGAIASVQHLLDKETFLVIHGDILTNFAFSDFIDFHLKEGSVATVALTTVDQPTQFGQLTLHGTKLVNFYQKTSRASIKSHLIHCGIYAFEPSIFEYFPKNQKRFTLEDVTEKLVQEKKVNGFVFEGQWFDVGSPENYEKAIKEFLPPGQK